jgi:hypothetical protein
LSVLEGKLSPRVLGLVIEWATLHQDELRTVWQQAIRLEPLNKIEPLRQKAEQCCSESWQLRRARSTGFGYDSKTA